MRMTRAATATIFALGLPTREAARAYALGWLDGDATITANRTIIALRLAGYPDEQRVAFRALSLAFGWDIVEGIFGKPDEYTGRALALDQAADLAVAGAFRFSLSRARLIHLLEHRLANYASQGRSLTSPAAAERARALFDAHLAEEAARLKKHPLAQVGFVTGKKGQPYPCLPS